MGYEDDGTLLMSVDSSSVTARTTSADAANVSITLSGVGEDGTLHSSGESASITAHVYNPAGGASTSYQWQLRLPGNAGWTSLSNGDENENIGSVSGANASGLTLRDINLALDGGALRCVVTIPTSDGTPEYYYSDIAPLSLSGNSTTTRISVKDYTGGSGTIGEPYTGISGYTTSETTTTEVTVQQPVTVEKDDIEYAIYSYTSSAETVYVAVAYDESGVGEDGTLHSSGESASITAHVYNPAGGASTSYQWQLRLPGNAGWTSLSNGDENENIGSVSGANASGLTLRDINLALDGGALRCVVTIPTSDGTPEYYYSDIAPLSLSGNSTTTRISVKDYTGGSGTIGEPYTGISGYTTSETTTTEVTVQQPVTVEKDDIEYAIYSYTSSAETVYVAVAYDESGEPQYYAATLSNGAYTVDEQLTPGETVYYHHAEDETDSE